MIKMNVETNSVTLYVCRNANSEISFLCNKPPIWAVQISIYPFQSNFTIMTDTTRIILHPCVINAIMIKSESTKFEKIDIDSIYRKYYRLLCLYALHYLHIAEDAEDVVQDCLTDFLERSEKGCFVSDIKSYLFMMVRNRCFLILKKENMIDRNRFISEFEEILTDTEYKEQSFMEARMWTAIDSLSDRCREAFLLCKRDGLKYEEVADQLGISVNTVKNQISKALKTIKGECRKIYFFFFG